MTDHKPMIHKAELAGYSSIVGQPIMLLNAQGAVVGQLALIGARGDYKLMVAEIADMLNAPSRHAYRVGIEVGRGSAAREIKEANDEAHACGAEREAWKDRAEKAETLVAECAEYLKEGETPRQRMDRDHKDVLALMELLVAEKVKVKALKDGRHD